MSESFVDLLLVRLGREEEKRKVLKLLITNLDLSVTEAENAVKDSPSVIKEAVPMSEARVIQKDLYPYIDLLPRLEEDTGSDSPEEEATSDSDVDVENIDMDSDETEIDEEGMYQSDEDESEIDNDNSVDENEEENDTEGTDYDPMIISSAREEIRSTNRCHICGRTPTDGERLAPCRTCSDLTCRDCFDRVAHVCNKCAADGKTIDRANEGMSNAPEEGLEFDTEETATVSGENKSRGPRIALTVFVLLLAMAAAFYFVDPMNLFNDDQSVIVSHSNIADEDTTSAAVDSVDSTLQADTADVNLETVDTVSVKPDTFSVDDPHGVLSIVLPEAYVAVENAPAVNFQLTVPAGIQADIPLEESEILFHQLSVIASTIPVVLDNGAFLVYNDTTSVLVLSLLHPEESGARIELMRNLAVWLAPSGVDQLVLVYRETIYQAAVPMSLAREVFLDVQGVLNPSQFRTFFSYREDCWESVNGPVVDWLSNIE